MPMRDRLIAAVIILTLAFGLTGCAETKFVPPTPEVRQHLGKIAVVAMPAQPVHAADKPVSGAGSGALVGAGEVAAGGLAAGAEGCHGDAYSCAFGLALGAAVAIVGAPIGAVVGAINAHSAEEVRAADESLRAALGEVKAGEELRNRVAAAAKARTTYDLTVPQATTATEPGQGLIASGFTSALEITIADLRLTSVGKIDPDATLAIVAEARLKHVADGSEIYRRRWAYVGVPKNYFQMASGHAAMLRTEIENGLDKLADRIVSDLFISNSPERQETSPRPGTVLTLEAPTLQKNPLAQTPQTPPLASSTKAATSTGPVDVPFRIDLQGQQYAGVGRLENGHFAGQVQYGNQTVVLTGDIKGGGLSVQATGGLNSNPGRDSVATTHCSAQGSASPAMGPVTVPMRASCGEVTLPVTLYLELPAV